MTAQRTPLVAANWKMNLLREEAEGLARAVVEGRCGTDRSAGAEVVLFPGFTLLPTVAEALAGQPSTCSIALGGQDLHPEASGAHTGDVSGEQLADVGCTWVLCGHSERRHGHGEGDGRVQRKIEAARRAGLRPLVCMGETAAERRSGETLEVLERQLEMALAALDPAALDPADLTLAYEPVWAIGTGDTATPEVAQEAHRFLREHLGEVLGEGAGKARLLYGGSVKPGNAADLAAQEDIDGFLVGGASLDPGSFLDIIAHCAGEARRG